MEFFREELVFFVEMNFGDGFVMFSSCFYGGSVNMIRDEERLIYSCFMMKGYL